VKHSLSLNSEVPLFASSCMLDVYIDMGYKFLFDSDQYLGVVYVVS